MLIITTKTIITLVFSLNRYEIIGQYGLPFIVNEYRPGIVTGYQITWIRESMRVYLINSIIWQYENMFHFYLG